MSRNRSTEVLTEAQTQDYVFNRLVAEVLNRLAPKDRPWFELTVRAEMFKRFGIDVKTLGSLTEEEASRVAHDAEAGPWPPRPGT